MTTNARYTLISSDTHAGANHKTYREYLDPRFHEDFDAWREKYKNPWKDLRDTDLRVRNWDNDRRDADQTPTASSVRSCSPTPCRRSTRASCCSRGRPSPRTTRTAVPACRRTIAGSSTSARAGPARAPASG